MGARAPAPHPTRLAHALGCSQPLISKHLRILRRAGLVESRPHPRDHRAHIYDIRREPFTGIEDWLDAIQRNYRRRHTTADAHSYGPLNYLNPALTTRGIPCERVSRAPEEPWER